jgi:subtilisin family serine protease
MRTRRVAELALVAGAAAALLGVGAGREPGRAASPAPPVSWQGLVGDGPRSPVDVGRRMIVVLKSRSLADRVAAAGGVATPEQEQRWTAAALAQQRLLLSRLQVQGVRIHPEYSFMRVLEGFSAQLDATAIAVLERDAAVQGVYPVRVAYPSSSSSSALERRSVASAVGNASLSLPGFDGRGITVALLDTGVDRRQASLLGSLATGVDIVDPSGDASPQAPPGRPADLERHGTELAGILAADRGPPVTRGVARGVSVLPIRIAGWQPDGRGGYAVYARTDQLIEGLEHAVDPNFDGDAHDAVRIALVGVAAPYAGFADDPAARAVEGALRLDTLVVAPAGNDGPAGPGFGSISGPGGAPASLTVGAADLRARTEQVRVSLRSGLEVVLDRELPLSSGYAGGRAFTSPVAAPGLVRTRSSFATPTSYFTTNGLNLVAGRAALVPAGSSPAATARSAALAGATAVLLYGAQLPAGGLPLDDDLSVPVVSIPARASARVLAAVAQGRDAGVSFGAAGDATSADAASVAPFSSTGLAYDGRVKPDVVASGVAVATTEPGQAVDGTARYGTVNGSSAAAAAVAGAAAVLAEARPSLDAAALRSVLVGTARPLAEAVTVQGAGLVSSLAAPAAAELAADTTTLAFGNADGPDWQRMEPVVVRNVSSRPLAVSVRFQTDAEGAAPVRFVADPVRFSLPAGGAQRVAVFAVVNTRLIGRAPAEGGVLLVPRGGAPLRLPWTVTFVKPPRSVLGPVRLSTTVFTPSDTAPALLTFRAGVLAEEAGRDAIQPVSLLRLELLHADGRDIGPLVTLRDLLPGRYAFGLTGRGPAGNALGKGHYLLRVTALPSLPGPTGVSAVPFTIK